MKTINTMHPAPLRGRERTMSSFATQLRALSEAATPGPWTADNHFVQAANFPLICKFYGFGAWARKHSQVRPNAELTAYLRNHADAIADAVEALRQTQEALARAFYHLPPELTPGAETLKYEASSALRASKQALARLNGEGT